MVNNEWYQRNEIIVVETVEWYRIELLHGVCRYQRTNGEQVVA